MHKQAIGEYVAATWGWDEDVQRQMFSERFTLSRRVIQVDGVDVGVLEFEERPEEVYLGLVELLPQWQNKGIGTQILRWLRRRAEESHRRLTLHVLKANLRARRLYEREGLRIVEEEPHRVLMSSS